MTAVVTGAGSGLERSSAFVLGSAGQLGQSPLGRAGDNVVVNAANGNLVVQNTDEILIGLGLSGSNVLSRTYNSQGTFTANGWQESTQRQVSGLTGTVNTAGSTVQHTAWDGTVTTYAYQTAYSVYAAREDAGPVDYMSFSGTTWSWVDTATRVTETYDSANGGRITSSTDADGNTQTFTYTGSLLTKVTTPDGEFTTLSYDASNRLTQATTTYNAGAQTLTRVRYGYDSSNRLTTVTVDMTPGDNSIADGAAYVTTYGYSGTSNRIASITQSDGSSLQIAYTGATTFKVSSLTQSVGGSLAARVTTFTYGSGQTTVTDPLGLQTVLTYDSSNRLTQITAPPAVTGVGTGQVTAFTYDALGNVLTVVSPGGNTTTYTYDAYGNRLTELNPAGDSIVRTYDTNFKLLTETRSPASGVSLTTRYVYDVKSHLRYVISAQGDVTEYRYNATGQQVAAVQYTANAYVTATQPTEATLNTWVTGITDKSTTQRADTTYDFRGNVQTVTSYAKVLSTGLGDTTSTVSTTTYVYDQAGNLLSRQSSGSAATETFVYDGLFRQTLATDLAGASTSVVFDDLHSKTVVTLANGTTQTSTYDLTGALLSTAIAGSGVTTATTTALYDADGRLRMTTDPTGMKTYFLYDNVNRKVADIRADGSVIEYRYNLNDQLIATIQHNGVLTSAQLTSLVTASGTPGLVTLASVLPAANAADRWNWMIYDTAGRVIETIDATGAVSVMTYDKASRLISTKSYANFLSAAVVTGFKTTLPTALTLPTADTAHDGITRDFYDSDGRLIAILDADGHLSQITYDAAGEKIRTVRSAVAATSSLWAAGTLSQLIASVSTSSQDETTSYVYDARGKLRFTIDASGKAIEYVYDALGNVLHTTEYATAITTAATYSLAYVQSHLTTSSADRTTRNVYDAASRLVFSIDAQGGVLALGYNTLGQVVKQVGYATLYAAAGDPSLSAMQTWATANAGSANNRIGRTIYDADGRAVYAVDAEGYATEFQYDLAGRVLKQIRYATTYTVTDSTTQAALASAIGALPSTAAVTTYGYDAAGRLTDVTDPMGFVTHSAFDALGQVTDRSVAYGTGDQATTHFTYDAAGRVASQTNAYGTSEATTTSFVYDASGHVLTSTDGRGSVTTRTYDAIGQIMTVSVQLDATTYAVTTNEYDSFGNRVKVTDPRGNVGYFYYDALNRMTLQVDPEGFVTQTTYSLGGQATAVTRYANRATNLGSISAAVPPTVAANSNDETTTIARDRLDRVTSTTDAGGFSESYALSAFGDRLTVTNKLGGVTTNVFDRRGLLTSETLPVSAMRSDGSVQASNVVNTYSYDGRGNKTQMVEAANVDEHRTTTFVYDKNDRVIQKLSDGGVNELTKYNKRGDIIETEDSVHARTLTYYDRLDRKIAEVNAVGTLSTWAYDAANNLLVATTYGDAIALPSSATSGVPSPANASNLRQIFYTYDQGNRLISSTVTGLLVGQYTGGVYQTSTTNISVQTIYDRAGNAIQQIDGRGNSTYAFYDKLGRKIAQVDQNNYLTSYVLNADGNVITEERFATALAAAVTVSSDPSTLRASVVGGGGNRITTFTYDRNGQRLTETRLGVNGYNGLPDSVIHYTYNGLGEVTDKSEATGEHKIYTYDAGGRQISATTTSFIDYTGTSVTPQTQTYYDGLNNVVRTRAGAAGAPSAGDHISTFSYGAGGRLFLSTDASGFKQYFLYDAGGHLTNLVYYRLVNASTVVAQDIQSQYDLLGRNIRQQTVEVTGGGDYTTTTYNAYGEVVIKGINGGAQETFSYDGGGRVWRTTSNGGVVQLFVYDAAGNQTLEVDAAGADISGQGAAAAAALVSNAGAAVTYRVFDKRGQVSQILQPNRRLTSALTQTLTSQKVYNAFGEVAQQTDARNNVTNFAYNTMGKLTWQQNPGVYSTAENGAITWVTPTTTYIYDASGRLVGATDANGNVSLRQLLAGTGYGGTTAIVAADYYPDSVTHSTFDVFGNQRTFTDGLGHVETRTYDAMDRLITVAHAQRSSDGGDQLVDHYTYDQLGHQLSHWNSQMGASVLQTTSYDAQGRVTREVDFGGHATTYSYLWNGAVQTAGLGTFGGWTKTTITADGTKTASEKTDYFGRTVGRIDFGGHAFGMGFDSGGRMLTQLSAPIAAAGGAPASAGQSLTYTYFNTGKVATLADAASAQNTTYGYDAAGNQISEAVVGTASYYDPYQACGVGPSTTLQQSAVTYDALNRMITLTDSGTAGGPSVSITYEYDTNGNIRHIASTYAALVNNAGNTSTTDNDWYKYDIMNRFVTTRGTFTGVRGSGVITRGDKGTDITYDAAGQRVSATSTLQSDILVAAHYAPPTSVTVTTPGHVEAAHHVDGFWHYECAPAHLQPASTTPGYWEDTAPVNLHDGHTIAGYYAYECVPDQYIPGGTTPGYWETQTTPGYWIPGNTTPGYWVTDASGNNVNWVEPVTSPATWVDGTTNYIWHDPVTEAGTFIPAHWIQSWVPPVVVPDTIVPGSHIWHDGVTTPAEWVPETPILVWTPPVDIAGGWIPETTTTVVTPGAWVAAGYVHAGSAHTEFYGYTEDGYLETVSISDGVYNPTTQTTSAPTLATATLRGLDARDAMGRVVAHYEFTPGTGPSATTLVPAHQEISGHYETVAGHTTAPVHIDGFWLFECIWVPPIDLPGEVVPESQVWIDTSHWVGDSYIGGGSGTGPASPGAYAVFVRNAVYDNNSNEIKEDTATLNADGKVTLTTSLFEYGVRDGSGHGTGAYLGGSVTHSTTTSAIINSGPSVYQAMDEWMKHTVSVSTNVSDTTTDYVWWDRAQQLAITYKPTVGGSSTNITTFNYNGDGRLATAQINDGRPRTITYVDNALGQIISRIDSTGPREYYYNFGGMQRGDIGNNGKGPSDTDYASAIAARQAAAQTGPYRNGAAANFADFDQSYVPINPASDAQTGSSYTVRDGDSLQSIAASLWGDGSLWYLIADANGLTGTTALAGGMALAIPNKVTNLHNDSTTYRVYDPNKAVGDVQPDDPLEATPQPAPAPKKKKHWYDVFVKIFDAVFNFVVTAILYPIAGPFAPILADAITQGMKIVTGQQDRFNWNELATTAITAGISSRVSGSQLFDSISNIPLRTAAEAVTTNVLTQGVKLATGLQSKFDWTSVAATGVGSYVQAGVSSWSGLPQNTSGQSSAAFAASRAGMTNAVVSGMAGLVAGAATRSLINGSDFGDNILDGLPDLIVSTFGNAIAGGIAARENGKSLLGGALDKAEHLLGNAVHAIGDTLGFDGHFGYQGGDGRTLSLSGVGNAIGDLIHPDAPVVAGASLAGAGDGYVGLLQDGVWRGDNADLLVEADVRVMNPFSPYVRRSDRYAAIQKQLEGGGYGDTFYFSAVSKMTANLANMDNFVAGGLAGLSPQERQYGESLSQGIADFNEGQLKGIFAGKITERGAALDTRLIRDEQRFIQQRLNVLSKADPGLYRGFIQGVNRNANITGPVDFINHVTDPFIARAADRTRTVLGGSINFASEAHRNVMGGQMVRVLREYHIYQIEQKSMYRRPGYGT